jgi:hypothetical protein
VRDLERGWPLLLKEPEGVDVVEWSGMNGSAVDKVLEAAGSVMNSVDEELSGSGGPGETPAVPAAA